MSHLPPRLLFSLVLITFLLHHKTHATVTTIATRASSTWSRIIICHSMSWNVHPSETPTGVDTFVHVHVSLAISQFHSTWVVVSSSNLQISQIESCRIFRRLRLTFVRSNSLNALQLKFLILWGMGKAHIFLQKRRTWLLSELEPRGADCASFSARIYALLTVKRPCEEAVHANLFLGN